MARFSFVASALVALASASSTLLVAAFTPVAPLLATSRPAASASSSLLRMSDVAAASPSDGGVVITGSAGGVGFAYAGEFMDRGYDVVICDVKDCSAAAKALTARHPNGRVYHTQCDVSDAKSVEKLGEFAKQKLGTLKYWINNAGVNGGRRALMDVPANQVELVVKVNLLGILLGTKAAMDIMAQQVSAKRWRHRVVIPRQRGGKTSGFLFQRMHCIGRCEELLPRDNPYAHIHVQFTCSSPIPIRPELLVTFSTPSEAVSRAAELPDMPVMVPRSVVCLSSRPVW